MTLSTVSASGIDDRQRAARAPLMRPLRLKLTASGDDFRLVKKCAPDLRVDRLRLPGGPSTSIRVIHFLAKEPATL
jgi:hypothetical protein